MDFWVKLPPGSPKCLFPRSDNLSPIPEIHPAASAEEFPDEPGDGKREHRGGDDIGGMVGAQQDAGQGDRSRCNHGGDSPGGCRKKDHARESDRCGGMTGGEAVEVGRADQPLPVVARSVPALLRRCPRTGSSGRKARGIDGHAGKRGGDHCGKQDALPPDITKLPRNQESGPSEQHQFGPVAIATEQGNAWKAAPVSAVPFENQPLHRSIQQEGSRDSAGRQ